MGLPDKLKFENITPEYLEQVKENRSILLRIGVKNKVIKPGEGSKFKRVSDLYEHILNSYNEWAARSGKVVKNEEPAVEEPAETTAPQEDEKPAKKSRKKKDEPVQVDLTPLTERLVSIQVSLDTLNDMTKKIDEITAMIAKVLDILNQMVGVIGPELFDLGEDEDEEEEDE